MAKHKLLLADDSVTIQKVVNLTFAEEGVEVIAVGDGNSAMDKLREDMPDIVMADVNMPGLNGYEICENIKQSKSVSDTPVILLVGSFEPFDEEEAKRVGADAHLTKPFQSISKLVKQVHDLLDSRSAGIDETTLEMPVQETESQPVSELEHFETDEVDSLEPRFENLDDELVQEERIGGLPLNDIGNFSPGTELPDLVSDENSFEEEIEEFRTDNKPLVSGKDDSADEEMENAFAESVEKSQPTTFIQSEEPLIDEPEFESEPESEREVPKEKDFHITQPLTNDDYQELAIEKPTSEIGTQSEDVDFDITDVGDSIPSEPPPLISKSDDANPVERESRAIVDDVPSESVIDKDVYSDFNALEDENPDLPMPEAASVLELDLDDVNLLDLDFPPMETEEDDELIVEERIIEPVPSVSDVTQPSLEETSESFDEEVPTFEEIPAPEEPEIIEPATPEKPEIADEFDFGISKETFIRSAVENELGETDRVIDKAVTPELVEVITKKVVERLSERAVREIAWEVVPQLADLIIKKMAEEKMNE